MHSLKIENIGSAKATTKTLQSNQIASIHGGLPREGIIINNRVFEEREERTSGVGGAIRLEFTRTATGEVFGEPNSEGERGLFAGGQAVGLLRGEIVFTPRGDSGFRVRGNRITFEG